MQKAGYFVINGRGTLPVEKRLAKSHLNFVYEPRDFFDGTDWSQRAKGQPFFAQIQIKEPHRGFVNRERDYPNAPIPPYYPEHPITRADWGNYLASIEVLDQKVGALLQRLEDEGLANNTLVIFFGDHGRPHVRGKQWLYEGGVHTPLIIRWPGKVKAGETVDGLASLLDLMPTTLAAAGADIPELPGKNLLDPNWQGHTQVFAARDRCGDAPDRIRSVRTQDFKYIRNFHPELPYLQHSGYKKLSYPVLTLMNVMHAQGRWDTPFMAQTRPPEELYDLNKDPHEMKNRADDPQYASQLKTMRSALDQWIEVTNDQGAVDESTIVDIEALKKEKWNWYARTMKKRGLDPNLTDRRYLEWWKKELGLKQAKK